MVQRQWWMFRVELISRSKSVHYGLYGHMGKAEGSSREDIGNAGVNLRVITFIGGHEFSICLVPQDMWQIVIPCQDLR